MKQIVNRFGKKALSAVLALAVILCSITATLSVFAEDNSATEPYNVYWRSPAIPMYEKTSLDLNSVDVQLTQDGSLTKGSQITWELDPSVTDAILEDGKLSVFSAGKYKLTATNGNNSLNVWVIANKSGEEDFYLENVDFSNSSVTMSDFVNAISASNSYATHYTPNTGTYDKILDVDVKEQRMEINGNALTTKSFVYGSNVLMYKSEILKDFADYTVDLSFITKSTNPNNGWATLDGSTGTKPAIGIIARATTSDSEALVKGSTALMARIANTGGVGLVGIGDTSKGFGGDGRTSLTSVDDTSELKYADASSQKTLWLGGKSSSKTRTVSLKLTQDSVVYSLDSNVIFDSSAASLKKLSVANTACDFYTQTAITQNLTENQLAELTDDEKELINVPAKSVYWESDKTLSDSTKIKLRRSVTGDAIYTDEGTYNTFASDLADANTGKGTIGFMVTQAAIGIYKMSVKLNNPVIPNTEKLDIYIVSDKTPYIPMVAGYKVDSARFTILLNETYRLGNEFTFTSTDDGITVNGGEIIANKKGAYVLDAKLKSDESVTTTMYVIVKNPSDTEYTLYDNDFRSLYESDGNGGYKTRTYENDWQTSVFFNGKADSNKVANYFGDLYTEDLTGAVNYADKLEFNMGYAPFTTAAVRAAMTAKGESGAFGKNIFGYTLLQNDIVSSFSNYKITATFKMAPGSMGVVGLVGRVNNYDSDYNLSLSGAAVTGFGITGAANYCSATGNQNIPGLYNITASGTSNKRADSAAYPTATSSPWVKNMLIEGSQNPCSTPIIREYTLEFNGETATYSTPAISEVATAASAETKGAVGFVIYEDTRAWDNGNRTSVLDFKVTLTDVNDTAIPMQKVNDVTDTGSANKYYEIDGSYDYSIDENGRLYGIAVAADKEFYGNKLTVPSSINGIEVAGLGDKAKSGGINYETSVTPLTDTTTNKYLNYIDFSNTNATYLNSELFYRPLKSYENLETVILPDSITTVESAGTFRNAASLRSFKAPANMKVVAYSMFRNCFSLSEVELNEGVGDIGYYSFSNCSNLGSITIPDSSTKILGGAFQGCGSLSEVKLGKNLQIIDDSAFNGCTMLKTIEIPKSVKSIGSNVFTSSLESIYIYSANCTIASGTIKANTVIYGYKGSTAQAYAETNGNTFIAIDDIDGATIAANSKFDLAATQIAVGTENVKGSDIAWDALRSDVCEIANNYLLAYAPGTVTVTGNYNGTAVSINVTVTERGTQSSVATTSIADDRVSITPLADGKYRFTVDDNVAYVPASLTVSENGEEITSITAYGITGRAYDAELFDVSAMYATATFEDTAETVERSVYMRGATVKVADSAAGVLAGIKFVTAVPQIKYNSTSGTIDLNGADITLADGTVVNFTDVGALIIPEALTGGTQLTIPEDFDVTSTTLKVGKYNAVNVPISTVNSTYESYSQISAVLNNIPDNMQDTRITSVTYLKYIEKNTGKVGFIYSDEKTISYDEVMAIADPYPTFKNGKYQDVISGGPVNELDNNASTDSISYGLNEDITFKYKVKGLYNVKYELYKDLPSENLYGTETYTTGTTKVLEGVCTDRVFTLTTQMKKAGTLRLRIFLLDAKGNAVTLPGNTTFFDTVVAADYANITEVMAEKGLVNYSQTEKVYDEMKTAFAAKSDVLKNAVAADQTNFDAFFDKLNTNPVLGDTYENGNLIYLSVVNITDNDVFLDFRLATDSVVGTTSTGSDNLFSDEVYKTQAKATNTQEYNLRPSTGVIVLPRNAADNSLSLSGGYQGYGESYGGITASANGVLAIRMNSHGFKNYEAAINTTYRDNMKSTNIENGGINGCIVGSYEAGMTDYKDMYQYGMLMRDYVALQFAKLFPAYNKAGGNVSTSGGSMGGWQSVSIAALDNDVTNASLSIVWMCSVGGNEYEYVPSNFMPTIVNGNTTRMLYSSVGAADYINKTLSQRAGFKVKVYGGLADPTAPVQGLIALYNKFECEKSLELIQFMKHGENYSSKLYRSERSAAAK